MESFFREKRSEMIIIINPSPTSSLIWQAMLARLSSQRCNWNEAGVEAAQQEEENMAVLDGCGRLDKAESE